MGWIDKTLVCELTMIDLKPPYPFYARIEEIKERGKPVSYRLDYRDNKGGYIGHYAYLFNAKRYVANQIKKLNILPGRLIWVIVQPKQQQKIKLMGFRYNGN